jgi:hypothetical protein
MYCISNGVYKFVCLHSMQCYALIFLHARRVKVFSLRLYHVISRF